MLIFVLDRIGLFIHILCKFRRYGFTAYKLKEITTDAKQGLQSPDDINIIYQVLWVRRIEEWLEQHEIGISGILLECYILQITHTT